MQIGSGSFTPQSSFSTIPNTGAIPNTPHVFPVAPKSMVFVLGRDPAITAKLREAALNVVELAQVRDIRIQLNVNTPTCVVIDVDMAPNETRQTILQLWRLAIGLPVIAISHDTSSANVRRALRNGAADFCAKTFDGERIEDVVDRVLESDRTGNPSPMEVRRRIACLTEREKEVIENCLQGTVTKVIAKHLEVTYQTIDKHRKKALRKMGVGSMVELSNVLYRTQLATLGCDYEFTS
ncbi:MAG: LuxR C-terminal-related transcriptional regulator [Planctomycetota bacterium]